MFARRRKSLGERTQRSERTDRTITVQVEDADDPAQGGPTVLLVRRSRVSTRTLPSRFSTAQNVPPVVEPAAEAGSSDYFDRNHQIATLPRPPSERDSQPEREGSAHSVYSAESEGSRLPMPDYDSGMGRGAGASVRRGLSSYIPRLPTLPFTLAFNPFRSHPRLAPTRKETTGSTYSHRSISTTAVLPGHLPSLLQSSTLAVDAVPVPAMIKDKRPLLLSTWSTSDKFTRKFPRPHSVINASSLASGPSSMFSSDRTAEGGSGTDRPARWTPHKWCLLLSVCTVFACGSAGLVCSLLTWFGAWTGSDVAYVASYDLLVLLTLASAVLLLAALTGLSGALLNSRPLLALYALLLWPAFLSLLLVAYPAYKRATFALDRKLSRAWSEYYTPLGRLAIQDALRCCGFLSALHDASASTLCYPRTPLPGCKGALWRSQRTLLRTLWRALFALVPLHVINIVVALVCANHVTRTFGKGLTPRRYRLRAEDVRADAMGLMQVLRERGVRPVRRPGVARAGSSAASFREDGVRYADGDAGGAGFDAEQGGLSAGRE